MKSFQSNLIKPIILLISITFFTIFDIVKDYKEGSGLDHIMTEFIIILFIILAIILILKEAFLENEKLTFQLATTHKDLEYWKEKSSLIIKGLSDAIDHQFESWTFTKSEKDVALLLIKGLSVKEISNIRGTAEKTTRAQASSIYKKSHLANRHELAAFFLEDLLI